MGSIPPAYNTSFILLKEAGQNIGLEVEHQRVLTDFELPLYTAVSCCLLSTGRKERVPLPLSSGYLEKYIQNLGLQQLYKEDDEFRCFINSVIALAFVPPAFVRVAWKVLMGEVPAFGNREDFFQYF